MMMKLSGGKRINKSNKGKNQRKRETKDANIKRNSLRLKIDRIENGVTYLRGGGIA
jgi:hypothetical protein